MTNPTLLIVNCGSSSLKFALFDTTTGEFLADGIAQALGSKSANFSSNNGALDGHAETKQNVDIPHADHAQALSLCLKSLNETFDLEQSLVGVGHRVVHGGESFNSSIVINANVRQEIEKCSPLAPLHNPANLLGITLLEKRYPHLPQVAVFDTAYHQTMPKQAYRYAIPEKLYTELGVRRYGFHGTSHRYVAMATANSLAKPQTETSLICAHLGNGASVCAIANGESIDTSMGMTPLEGLVMGTRSGDIDPGVLPYLNSHGYSIDRIDKTLNKESGLLGLSNESNDMRTLTKLAENGHEGARLAIDVFCFRLAKYIAAMLVSIPNLDALVFTGGIGENSAHVRRQTSSHLKHLGFDLDASANIENGDTTQGLINTPSSRYKIMIIATDEERMIAQDTLNLITN